MTWNSGICCLPPDGVGFALIITDAYPEPVYITDDDVRADEQSEPGESW